MHPLNQKMKVDLVLIPLLLVVCDEILTSMAVTRLPPTRLNFYPFGQSEGDRLLLKNDDQSSGSVPISIPFPYFDQYHNSLFVSREFWPLVIVDGQRWYHFDRIICEGRNRYELFERVCGTRVRCWYKERQLVNYRCTLSFLALCELYLYFTWKNAPSLSSRVKVLSYMG